VTVRERLAAHDRDAAINASRARKPAATTKTAITRPGAQARARRSLRALRAVLCATDPLPPEVARVVGNAAADLRAIAECLAAQAGGDRGGS